MRRCSLLGRGITDPQICNAFPRLVHITLVSLELFLVDTPHAHGAVAVTSRPLTDLSFPYMAFRALPPDISIGMLRHHLRRHRSIEAWIPLCRDLRPFGSQIIETYENFSSRAIWAVTVA